MPKNDEALQRETGVKKAYTVTPITDDYPRIISEVNKVPSVEKVISPEGTVEPKKEKLDEEYGVDQNLHDQYVKPNDIEVSPKSFKQ